MIGAATLLALLAGAELLVPAGALLSDSLARARPGDTIRLGPGEHRGTLGRLTGVTVIGAGAGLTVVLAPPGEDGAVVDGDSTLRDLSLVAGPARTGLKALAGAVTLDGVALVGGSTGLFVDGARVTGRELWLAGEYGLLQRTGAVTLVGVTASGTSAGVALLGGDLDLSRGAVTGPSREAAVTVGGGTARLAGLVVRTGGPSGLSVSGGRVVARDLTISGPRESGGFGGDCLLVLRGKRGPGFQRAGGLRRRRGRGGSRRAAPRGGGRRRWRGGRLRLHRPDPGRAGRHAGHRPGPRAGGHAGGAGAHLAGPHLDRPGPLDRLRVGSPRRAARRPRGAPAVHAGGPAGRAERPVAPPPKEAEPARLPAPGMTGS